MKETRCHVNGVDISYAMTGGSDSAIVMLHGVTRRWQTFLPLFHSFQLRWNVCGLDFRGHGLSSRTPGQYAVMDYVADVVGFVEQQFRSGRFAAPVVMYGHSLGSMVAAAAAAQLGDRIAAVVLEDPPFHTMGAGIRENVLFSFFSGMQQFAGDRRPVAAITADLAELQLYNPENGQTTRLGDIRDVTALRFTASSLKLVDPEVFVPIISGDWLAGYDMESIFKSLRCPALLLQADLSAGGMLSDHDVRSLKNWTADLSHIYLPDVGHVIHVARTQQLVNFVSSFLETVSL
jgi:pimeloyl-ACP methyl ester carboxylesterase